jgi:hypothetical protein
MDGKDKASIDIDDKNINQKFPPGDVDMNVTGKGT